GRAGASPAPLGDSPSGRAERATQQEHGEKRRGVLSVPSGESPDGTGQWPVLPAPGRCSEGERVPEWRVKRPFDYATLTRLAADAPPFVSLINPADARFVSPDNMPGKIAAFCRETGQAAPSSPGAMIRCVLESLALLYQRTLRQVEQLTGRKIERLHIVGGGSRNELLNQFTANALQIPVLA